MALEVLKEVTEWAVDFRQPNHTYLLDGDKVLAHRPWHTGEPVWGTPMRFDRRRRKFEPADLTLFGVVDAPAVVKNTKVVTGSKGDEYTVDLDQGTCTCSGFKFRGRCRHLETLVNEGSLEIG